ncbi:MAG: nucleotide exchange factor GrpE, partial [Candidatus Nealsonbacteria bacterium]
VEEVEAKDKESGTIIEETQKGYTIHGKVVRPAKVKISK